MKTLYTLLFLFTFSLVSSVHAQHDQTKSKSWWQSEGKEIYSKLLRSDTTLRDNPKARHEFEILRTRDPRTGTIPRNIRQKELVFKRKSIENEQLPDYASSMHSAANIWTSRGPYNVGGRTRALGVDITNDQVLIAGAISGGIWKSTDQGQSWTKSTNSDQAPDITSLAQDHRQGKTNIWYYSTGEAFGNSAEVSGNGIYKSIDSGNSWNLLSSTASNTPQLLDSDFDFNHRVVVNPFNGHVLVANIGGIYLSKDEGNSFELILENGPYTFWTDVIVSPEGTTYAVIDDRGIFSFDSNYEYTEITPQNDEFTWYGSDRKVLAVSPAASDLLYVVGDKFGIEAIEGAFFIYNSLTGTWEDRSNLPEAVPSGLTSGHYTQGGYDLMLTVSPIDPNLIIVGGVNLYRSTDGFRSNNHTTWIGGYDAGDDSYGVYPFHHPDQHGLIFLDEKQAISINDGGVQKTVDISSNIDGTVPVAWIPLNNGYLSTQSYDISIGPNNMIISGFQDNGTWSTSQPDSDFSWQKEAGGDGGANAFSSDGKYRFVSFQNGYAFRFSYHNGSDIFPYDVTPMRPRTYIPFLFIVPMELDPKNDDLLYLGGSLRKLYVNTEATTNGSEVSGWKKIELEESAGVISAIGTSKTANKVYVGTASGRIFIISDPGGKHAIEEITGQGGPWGLGYISDIEVNPVDSNEILVTFSNYNLPSIFHTLDAGTNWIDISGNLEENEDGTGRGPSVRTAGLVVLEDASKTIYAGTSTGLYRTSLLDGAATTWQRVSDDLIGNAVVEDLAHGVEGTLAIGTHGNGIFSTKINDFVPEIDLAVTEIPLPLSPIINASEIVSVEIHNRGASDINSFVVTLYVNDDQIVIDEVLTPIAPGEKIIHQFSLPYESFIEAGDYEILVIVSCEGDEIEENNSLSKVKSRLQYIAQFPYYQGFESEEHGWTANGSWELGEPSQRSLNNAFQEKNAWMTDLFNHFESNSSSLLMSPIFDFSSLSNIKASFHCNYQIGNIGNIGMNGARMMYRTASNAAFEPIPIQYGIENFYNYNSILPYNGQPGWSGTTNGKYVRSTVDLNFLAGESFVQLAITMDASTGGLPDEGFAMDNFSIQTQQASDLSISEVILPENLSDHSVIKILVENHGSNTEDHFEVAYSVNASEIERVTISSPLLPGFGHYHTFTIPYDFSNESTYSIVAEVISESDANPQNNLLTKDVFKQITGYYFMEQIGINSNGLSATEGAGTLFSGSGKNNVFISAWSDVKRSFEVQYLPHQKFNIPQKLPFYFTMNGEDLIFGPEQTTTYECRETVKLGSSEIPGILGNNDSFTLGIAEDVRGACYRDGIIETYFQFTKYNSIPSVNSSDSLALLALYHSTNGEKWIHKWNLNESVFHWYGVTVSPEGRVIDLALNSNNLKGTLPDALKSLTSLESLTLQYNQISGNIPDEIGNLINLKYLDLSSCGIEGQLPNSIGNLTNLRLMRAEYNKLQGSIPESIGTLSSLKSIHLSGNQLSGDVPEGIANLDELVHLELGNNRLQSLPNLSGLVNLEIAEVHGNALDFEDITPNLSVLTDYRYQADLGNELIESQINDEISLEVSLPDDGSNIYEWFRDETPLSGTEGVLSFNFSGPEEKGIYHCYINHPLIEPEELTLSKTFTVVGLNEATERADYAALKELYMTTAGSGWWNSHNWLSSKPFSEWYGLRTNDEGRVTHVELSGNNLMGTIPTKLAGLSQLETLNLSWNALSEGIPDELSLLTTLKQLNLSNNPLGGIIPDQLGNLTNLQEIYLDNTSIVGNIPNSFDNLNSLVILSLPLNQLSGELADQLPQLPNLQLIDLHSNNFSGNIPSSINGLTNMRVIRISENNLSGQIPTSIGTMKDLIYLMLGFNDLTGSIPNELGNLVHLELLGLTNNKLSGEIPESLGNLTKLTRLGLKGNKLTGKVPETFSKLTRLTNLNIHQNSLSELPDLSNLNINAAFDILQSFKADNNAFDFKDLVPNAKVISSYDQQAPIDTELVVPVRIGGTYVLSVSDDTPNTLYQWYFNESPIVGARNQTYTVSDFDPSVDFGSYYCKLKNPAVPHVILNRSKIEFEWNEQPQNILLSNSNIAEDQATQSLIGILATEDPNSNDQFQYSLEGENAAYFRISGDNLNELWSNTSFDYEARKSYLITIRSTDMNGSSISKEFNIQILDVLGLSGTDSNLIDVYPNPSSDFFKVSFDESLFGNKWSLVSSEGKVIMKKTAKPFENLIDVSNLPSGIYFVKVETKGEKLTKRLIVQ